ncbi:MAG: glycosyltransferase family 4 protein [Anaerolineaceae bacterium]|nr:glycosyltransferase family 4 protein [Anaerolineaceae bacterium]
MHILIIHQAFASLDEAGGTRHYEMAQQLVKHGHRVTIIASSVSYLTGKTSQNKPVWCTKQEIEPGITILRAYTYRALHKSFFHRLISFFSFMTSSFFIGLSLKDIDVVWGTTPPIFQAVSAWLIARLKGLPYMLEVRDLWPAFAIAVGVLKNKTLIRASLWLERFLYRHADVVVVNSPGFIEHVRGRGAKDVRLVANGVDTAMFNPQNDGMDFRKRWDLEDKFIALYAGAHGLSNDLGVVLEAAQLTSKNSNIQYVMVGDGKEKPALQAQATTLGLTNITFEPPVIKSEMTNVLAAANVCIAILKPLELYKTTYPNKVFDYMAAGRPVLLAIDGVIREVVENAHGGVFVAPGDAQAMANELEKMAANPARTREMGSSGRAFVEQNFERSRLTQQMEDLLIEIKGKYGRNRSDR